MDNFLGGGNTDAYVKCDYMGKTLKTHVKEQSGGQVLWLEEMLIPAQIPIVSKRIVFRIYDKDNTGDELIGTVAFDIEQIIQKHEDGEDLELGYEWADIYGADPGKSGKHSTAMRKNPEYASQWLGRILMQVEVAETENPELTVRPLGRETIERAEHMTQKKVYECKAEVLQGMLLPGGKSYQVEIQIGDIVLKTNKPTLKLPGYNLWNY